MIEGERRMEGERDVTIRYVTDGDYRPKYANGVYGGIGTRGEVVMNFFTEGFALPDKETIRISEKGGPMVPVGCEPSVPEVVRTVSEGIIMSRESAEDVYRWLGKVLGKG